LRRCLDSIINQTYRNIEVICVNDASIDNSLEILNEYAKKDDRIVVVDKKENEDASFARKSAFEFSNGKYILPVDSDDYIELNMIENLYRCTAFNGYDICCCGYFEEKGGKTSIFTPQFILESKIERMKYGTFGFGNTKVLWNKLVKREIYEKVVFKKTGTNEDCLITAQLCYYANRIGFYPLPLYHWQHNENSVTNNKLLAQKRYEDRKANYEHIIEFCKNKFGDDLSILEPELSARMADIEKQKVTQNHKAAISSSSNNFYNQQFYQYHQTGSYNSAKIVLPKVLEVLPQINSIVDFGCGIGTWLSVFKELGVSEIKGYDGHWVDKSMLKIPIECFSESEFDKGISIEKKYDLAISLEVAEHLPSNCAEFFVELLVKTSDFILFSAAIPFQGGTNHINEQWPEYWYNIFNKKGYACIDFLRKQIWNENNVEWYYRQNIVMFAKKERLNDVKVNCANLIPLSLVHPGQYLHHINKIDALNKKLNKNYDDDRLYNIPSKTFTDKNVNMELFRQYVNFVEIEVFSYCNRKCSFCQNSYIDRHSQNIFMPSATFSKIIDELAMVEYSGKLSFHRFNEPLADRVILDRVREARKKLPNAFFKMHTNGDFVTREYLDELADAGLNYLPIMRYPSPNDEFSVEKQKNIMIELAEKLDLKYNFIDSVRMQILHSKMNIEVRGDDLKKFSNRAGSVDLFKDERGIRLRKEPCRAPFTDLYFCYDGSVVPCCNIRHDVPEHKDMIMGNASEQSIFDIYAGFKMALLRYQLKDENTAKIFPCSVCDYYNYPLEQSNEFKIRKKILHSKHRLIDKKILLFGSGNFGKIVKEKLESNGLKVDFYVDNDKSKQGQFVNGLKILSPEDSRLISESVYIVSVIDKNVICSIYKQLKEMNISEDNIFNINS